MRPLLSAASALAVLALLPRAAWAQEGPETPAEPSPEVRAAVDSLLLFTEARSFVEGVGPAFGEHFVRLSTNLTTLADVEEATSEAFADSLLLGDVAAFVAAEAEASGEPELLPTLLDWLGRGASAEVRAITDTTRLGQDFDEFVAGLRESPPDPARLEVVGRWARAQRAGEFVLLLDEAQREAAYRVAGALDPEAPRFEPLAGDAFTRAYTQTMAYAVASFLHRLQPVPDTLLAEATREYESEAGQWFVETYSLALAHAVREASLRIVEELGARGPPGGARR